MGRAALSHGVEGPSFLPPCSSALPWAVHTCAVQPGLLQVWVYPAEKRKNTQPGGSVTRALKPDLDGAQDRLTLPESGGSGGQVAAASSRTRGHTPAGQSRSQPRHCRCARREHVLVDSYALICSPHCP